MVRFILDKIRQAPGPLKQPRLILADLAEEVYDLLGQHLGRSHEGEPCAPCGEKTPEPTGADPASTAVAKKRAAASTAQKTSEPKKAKSELTPPADLATAMENPGNRRKQEFKVLAILWDARSRNMDPLSAKSIAQHGERIGLSIRHENVRKVIRMRLEKFVSIHSEGAGNGTVYRYGISQAGLDYFTNTYLN